jgi:hypothetical protein
MEGSHFHELIDVVTTGESLSHGNNIKDVPSNSFSLIFSKDVIFLVIYFSLIIYCLTMDDEKEKESGSSESKLKLSQTVKEDDESEDEYLSSSVSTFL